MSIELYGDEFFKKRVSYNKRSKILIESIVEMYHPSSYIDCGAALGDLVNEALNKQIDAYGVEGNELCFPYLQCPKEKMLIFDLSNPLLLDKKFDVLTCLEVAEHIEELFVDIFVENICKLSDILIISICDYGPTTKIHPTVKSHNWWIPKFQKHNFIRQLEDEIKLKMLWEPIKSRPAVKEAYRNLIIFKKI
jgi:2-polyprenyl-3-methyl-5-hydroxy-6-metoxy-1,4-benzoquinol methylase